MDKPKRMITEELERKAFEKIIHDVFNEIVDSGDFEAIIQSIVKGEIDPYTACDTIVSKKFKTGTP